MKNGIKWFQKFVGNKAYFSTVRDVAGVAKRRNPSQHIRIPGVSPKPKEASQDNNRTLVKEQYELGELLGRGRFGVVRAALDQATKNKVAIKIMNKGKDKLTCQTELMIYSTLMERLGVSEESLKRLTLPLDIHESEENLYIIMEFICGGDLFDKIIDKEFFREEEFQPLLRGIVDALSMMHNHGVVHRDIKPENVLLRPIEYEAQARRLCEYEPVLTDFGLSYILGKPDLIGAEKPAGTFGYVSPEILSAANNRTRSIATSVWGSQSEALYDPDEKPELKFSSDIWSLGVLCYASLCGELPFPASMDGTTSVEEHLQQVYAGPQFTHRRWDLVSPPVKVLVAEMLHYSPFNRPSLEYIRQHEWIKLD